MTSDPIPDAPPGTKESGRKLWDSMQDSYIFDEHELVLLREACRCADLLDDLAAIVGRDGPMVSGRSGDRSHPALVEARLQKAVMARLLAALRLPAGEEGDHQAGARRPQRRGRPRGVYGIKGSVS